MKRHFMFFTLTTCMVEEELDSLEAFAKSMETDDSGDSGVDE